MPLGQRDCCLPAGIGDDPLNCAPGHAHGESRFLLCHALAIAQSKCFQLITMQMYLLQLGQRSTSRLVCVAAKIAVAISYFFGSWRHKSIQLASDSLYVRQIIGSDTIISDSSTCLYKGTNEQILQYHHVEVLEVA